MDDQATSPEEELTDGCRQVPEADRRGPLVSAPPDPLHPACDWFARRGWEPFGFQRALWQAWQDGRSGLLHAPTGLGKTLAAWLGPVLEELASPSGDGLRVLWITPLRALAVDTLAALQAPLAELGLSWRVEARTGDTSDSVRKRQRERLPHALVTTPESLSVMLSRPDCAEQFRGLRGVVVDEWHELLATRRGVQTELCLARLRAWHPRLRTWGLSATIGNLEEARDVLLGAGRDGDIIAATERREVVVETLIPDEMEKFPWSGHLGVRMVPQVVARLREAATTLLFTNTRAQAEIWHQALLDFDPGLAPDLALHHGSLDKKERAAVEERLRAGTVRCVVCTSSLDLGVDFSPVEQVIQVGSPKGMARLMQRAGRSGHQPGRLSRIVGVPAHAFELIEFAAAREAMGRGEIEARRPLAQPIDVLLQHLVTVACGGGFLPDAMRREILTTHAFAGLSEAAWEWLLSFITTGGHALRAYPQYRKVGVLPDGTHAVTDERIARLHRMTIGTITSDQSVTVQYAGGRRLGSVEEWFISGIRPGGQFHFAGRRLELVRFKDLKAVVKDAKASRRPGQVPSWQGGKSPLSTELAAAVSRTLSRSAAAGDAPELRAVAPILAIQSAWSIIPAPDECLVEETSTREGSHVYVYPFAGRLVHEGLATLVAWRIARDSPVSIHVAFNDYGFELHSRADLTREVPAWQALLAPEHLLEDLEACLNTTELARRHFREIARVAGLVLTGFPGQPKSARALQASSGLLFDVFARYDPDNLLLAQARREILDRQFEVGRLRATLEALRRRRFVKVTTARLTPMAFPLWASMLSSQLSTESFTDRLARMLAELESAAARPLAPESRPERDCGG